jgi:hypothetical protein
MVREFDRFAVLGWKHRHGGTQRVLEFTPDPGVVLCGLTLPVAGVGLCRCPVPDR